VLLGIEAEVLQPTGRQAQRVFCSIGDRAVIAGQSQNALLWNVRHTRQLHFTPEAGLGWRHPFPTAERTGRAVNAHREALTLGTPMAEHCPIWAKQHIEPPKLRVTVAHLSPFGNLAAHETKLDLQRSLFGRNLYFEPETVDPFLNRKNILLSERLRLHFAECTRYIHS
jgi:hypothetical protein